MARTVDIEHVVRPRRPRVCRILRKAGYWKCLSCTLLLIGCGFYAGYCHVKHLAYSGMQPLLIHHHGPCAQGYNFVPIVFGLMLYIVYLMECWHSRRKLIQMKKVKVEEALNYLAILRESHPIVWWKSVCYHYMRRTRQVTRYRNGDAVPATQVYYERVDSHTAGNIFLYEVCGFKDISKNVMDLENFPLTRIRLSKGFVFACMQAATEFEEQRTRFFNENETRDDYMEVREGMDLSDVSIPDEILCFSTKRPPWFLNPVVFWICSVCLLSWPLRRAKRNFLLKTSKYYDDKIIRGMSHGHNALSSDQVIWNHLSQSFIYKLYGSSNKNFDDGDSRSRSRPEITIFSQERWLVVPSYSEAMLLQPSPQGSLAENRIFSRPLLNNENLILPNYGAIAAEREETLAAARVPSREDDQLTQLPRFPRSSRPLSSSHSMNFQTERREIERSGSNRIATGRPRVGPPRSLSISGMTNWSNGYELIDNSPELPSEPPPPYEMALRMCAPLYERLRRSLSSRLNSLSHSSSKELKSINSNNNP